MVEIIPSSDVAARLEAADIDEVKVCRHLEEIFGMYLEDGREYEGYLDRRFPDVSACSTTQEYLRMGKDPEGGATWIELGKVALVGSEGEADVEEKRSIELRFCLPPDEGFEPWTAYRFILSWAVGCGRLTRDQRRDISEYIGVGLKELRSKSRKDRSSVDLGRLEPVAEPSSRTQLPTDLPTTLSVERPYPQRGIGLEEVGEPEFVGRETVDYGRRGRGQVTREEIEAGEEEERTGLLAVTRAMYEYILEHPEAPLSAVFLAITVPLSLIAGRPEAIPYALVIGGGLYVGGRVVFPRLPWQ